MVVIDLVAMATYFFMYNQHLRHISDRPLQLLSARPVKAASMTTGAGDRTTYSTLSSSSPFGGMGVRGRDLVSKIDEEGKLNGVKSIHGMRIKTYLLRALAFSLQSGNAHLAILGSQRSRKGLE